MKQKVELKIPMQGRKTGQKSMEKERNTKQPSIPQTHKDKLEPQRNQTRTNTAKNKEGNRNPLPRSPDFTQKAQAS